MRALALLVLALLGGCAAASPPELAEDRRFLAALDEGGRLAVDGLLSVEPPRLLRPALAGAASVDSGGTLWPLELPPAFVAELEQVLDEGTGFDVSLDPASSPAACRLELRVTRFRARLVECGPGSAIAPVGFLLPHLASFYNAPDEHYRVDYRLQATFRHPERPARRATLRGSKTLALTDFQRGWTLFSRWPVQTSNLGEADWPSAWETYGPSVLEQVEPFARREVLIELLRFVRECARELSRPPRVQALVAGLGASEREAAALAAALEPKAEVELLVGRALRADDVQTTLWRQVDALAPGDLLLLWFGGEANLAPAGLRCADRPLERAQLLEPLRAATRRGARALVLLDGEVDPALLGPDLSQLSLWIAGEAALGPALRRALAERPEAPLDAALELTGEAARPRRVGGSPAPPAASSPGAASERPAPN